MAEGADSVNCSHSSDSEAQVEKESAAYQTDFSVTNRLLPQYNTNNSHSLPANLPAVTVSYRSCGYSQSHNGTVSSIQGWQNLLPTDQGAIPSKSYHHAAWRNTVPNASLTQEPHGGAYQSVGYGNTSTYHPTQSPDSSTGVTSFAVKDFKETSMKGGVLSNGERSVFKRSHLTENHDDEEEDESGDESEGESSAHSQSSHGEAESVDEPKKPKRTRTAYSNHQLDQLELAFSRSHYPDVFTREDLANKLNIKEDRIQVWFQNRRARYRKQERTGSISLRSKYRQKRLQKLQHNQAAAAAAMSAGAGMYSGYYQSCGNSPSQAMLASPQSMSPYMPGFAFPPNYIPNSLGGSASSSGAPADSLVASVQTSVASPSYLPSFNTIKSSIPIPAGYMTMGLSQNCGPSVPPYPTYGSTPPSSITVPSMPQK